MITLNQALEKAISFIDGLKPEYLGSKPESIRVETIQLFGKEWVVVVSYNTSKKQEEVNTINKLFEALSVRRFIKEVEIDSETGEVVAMRNPEAPVTTGESLAA